MNFEEHTKSERYYKAKKRVEEIKGFYWHLVIYIAVNLFISVIRIFNEMDEGVSFFNALTDFGTYAIWLFWGIGIFFHALGVFNTNPILGKKWEEKKLKEFMERDGKQQKRLLK